MPRWPNVSDDHGDDVNMRMNGQVFMSMPRAKVLRDAVMDHMIHHRGQLSVYLRMLNVAVAGMWGPTTDDKESQEAVAAAS